MDRSRQEPRQRLYTALFHSAWVIMLLAAAWQRFSLPLQPAADADVGGFLTPGIQALTGHGFQHTNNRNFLYPGLIYGLLSVFQDFRAIAVMQHLLGLATGALLLAAWCEARRCIPDLKTPQWVFDLTGLFTMAVYLFATEPQQFEYFIRPDVVCPFFATLILYLIVRFLAARKIDHKPRTAAYLGAFALFLALLMPNLKPSFWLTSVFTTIPIWLALFDRKDPLIRRLLMVGVPIAAALLLMWLPERHFAASDGSSERFLPESLFSIHALMIREQIADDVAHPDPSVPYSHEKLQSVLTALDAGIAASKAESPHHLQSLGYDADYLLYHQPFFNDFALAEGFKWDVILGFYKYYYRRTWLKRPLTMLHKVTTQLGLFYNLECPAYCDKRFELQRSYNRSLFVLSDPTIQRNLKRWPPAVMWQEKQAVLASSAPMIDMNKALRRTVNALGNAYLPAMLLFLVCLPRHLLNRERRAGLGLLCALLAIGYGFNFGNNLGISILHTLEVSRYTYVQFATTVWTEMLTFVFLIEMLIWDIEALQQMRNLFPPNAGSRSALVLEESN